MEPLFKVRDKIRIKEGLCFKYGFRCNYPIKEMSKVEGNVYVVESVYRASTSRSIISAYDDGYEYTLRGTLFVWTSSMLEKVENKNYFGETQPKENNDSVLKIKLKTKNKIKLNFNN